MTRIFFTYVWGAPGNPAWPLTFATKAARSHARKVLTEGDLVFTVGTRGEPTQEAHKGRVLGVYCVSDLAVNTQDYELPRKRDKPEFDSVTRFPFALHPIAVFEVISPENMFAKLVGPLTPNHHLQAQSKLVELDGIAAAPLLELDRHEVLPALPKTEFGKGLVAQKNSKLAPKHQGSFTGAFGDHDIWFVYTLVLRNAQKKALAVKVGYSSSPEAREAAHNGPLASEVTGLSWKAEFSQPTSSEDAAREVEQFVLSRYAKQKLASNGEILAGVDPMMVQAAIATAMRDLSSG
jgi:hypothetical protein